LQTQNIKFLKKYVTPALDAVPRGKGKKGENLEKIVNVEIIFCSKVNLIDKEFPKFRVRVIDKVSGTFLC
jgi:hypothetical protein